MFLFCSLWWSCCQIKHNICISHANWLDTYHIWNWALFMLKTYNAYLCMLFVLWKYAGATTSTTTKSHCGWFGCGCMNILLNSKHRQNLVKRREYSASNLRSLIHFPSLSLSLTMKEYCKNSTFESIPPPP